MIDCLFYFAWLPLSWHERKVVASHTFVSLRPSCPCSRSAILVAAMLAVAAAVAAAARRGIVAVQGAQLQTQATRQLRCGSCDGMANDVSIADVLTFGDAP